MTDSKAKDKDRKAPTERQISQRRARESADAARDTRKSHEPGVDDDSDIVQSLVGALGAPVEGALDSIRERERYAEHGQELGPDQVGGVTGQRAEDIPQYGEERPENRGKVPTKPEDAEAEPSDIAEDMTRDRPGARARR